MSDYLICTQNIKNNEFGNEPSKAIYLRVPDNELVFLPKHKIEEKEFLSDIIDQKQENIIIFIHGYNSDDDVVIERHRTLNNFCMAKRR